MKSRADWGARSARSRTPFVGTDVALHWEGPKMGNYEAFAVPSMLRSIQDTHMRPGGLGTQHGASDIAYNFIIDRFGTVWEGRGFVNQTGANGTDAGNIAARAICFLFGEGDVFTDAMQAAAKQLINQLHPKHVRPHSFYFDTQCPGNDVRKWITDGLALSPVVDKPKMEDEVIEYSDKYTWNNDGAQVQVFENGAHKAFGAKSFGNIVQLDPNFRRNFTKCVAVIPRNVNDSQAGYGMCNENGDIYWMDANTKFH